MKKLLILVLALVMVLSLASCGGDETFAPSGGSTSNQSGGIGGDTANKNGAQTIITVNKVTGEESEARKYYYAEMVREEFAFDKDDILTDYKKIYTFISGVTEAQKEDALDRLTVGGFAASIDGNTIVVDGNGNYLGRLYADSDLEEIKESLDRNETTYNLGDAGTVNIPE